ncbi:hypothetical protein BGW36DRAFT_381427 [Talaromyces proteolyticus]|uniref:Uncharacterized protein n=1 Tax=Talaromyces proteolyticus TaxID=1131652 RepID=A0AAD4KNH9_9EURO|nr:uncharacterized protein BGW36DRAFT_381427 [Talaromyces proteolyticus]KAH8696673.1 hypothetical protein BGW36DRAFT_381427 [Talaromyces proteolyticus]
MTQQPRSRPLFASGETSRSLAPTRFPNSSSFPRTRLLPPRQPSASFRALRKKVSRPSAATVPLVSLYRQAQSQPAALVPA